MRFVTSLAICALAAVPVFVTSTAAPAPVTVLATDFTFQSAALVVPAGTTVTWVQGTAAFNPHTVTSTGNFDYASGASGPGDTVATHTFNTPGTFNYFCKPHAGLGMRGVVVVV